MWPEAHLYKAMQALGVYHVPAWDRPGPRLAGLFGSFMTLYDTSMKLFEAELGPKGHWGLAHNRTVLLHLSDVTCMPPGGVFVA
jgi:hypothetical protein